ncbi:hypothetical protein HPB47_028445 [Ixodes persulcatus]|uniref:Uncharacterized protein n=1 Tax=Ixodes persulcatus TaxID=34615 RepID=A0AC60PUW8_IXOPE|nr:hypothetical protein HPB47_028445 [Ixodes persulcatus]
MHSQDCNLFRGRYWSNASQNQRPAHYVTVSGSPTRPKRQTTGKSSRPTANRQTLASWRRRPITSYSSEDPERCAGGNADEAVLRGPTGRIPLTLAVILGCWAPWRSLSAEAASLPCDVFDDPQGLCRCTLQEKTPTNDSHNQVWVTCVNITSLEHLSLVLSPMRGRRIDKFQLGLSRVGYVPSNLFLDIAVQELQFWDSPLSTFVLGDERAFLGLESTLRWLSMRRCRLNSSLPFQRMGHLHALETLDLSFNELTVIRESWFRNSLNGLRSLLLRGNRIGLIESRAFAGLLRLYQLDLAQNNLKHLERSMFPSGLFFLDLRCEWGGLLLEWASQAVVSCCLSLLPLQG